MKKSLKTKNWKIDTLTVHAGITKNEYGAVVPPIYQVSTFRFKDVDQGVAIFSGTEKGYIYTRLGNPTIKALEDCVTKLENGFAALACASGMAAINTLLQGLLKQGDHIICSRVIYSATVSLIKNVLSKFGVEISMVDTSSVRECEDAIKPNTKLIFLETPGNPTLVISDIAAIAKLAHRNKLILAVDNTFASPIIQRPLELGADIVIHSMTKYLNGHADVVAGIIVVKDETMYNTLRPVLNDTGGIIDPFQAFLVHRGIKTLSIRMERHSANALKIANFLENHPKVKWVRYPWLKSHPGYSVARKQMKSGGGMISFGLKGGFKAGKLLMNNVKLCTLAVSLGGVETLIEHPASMTHSHIDPKDKEAASITDDLVRLSVGIENVDDIIQDLNQALAKI
uniref:L-methionine gamma-lyase n=1 Tax=candidate division WOR-3 bacterium TaxID=2052148 RepID=A0A7C6EET5_UNCW3